MPKLTPTQLAFLKAVQRGEATQIRRNSPYRTVVKGSDRAVSKTVLDGVAGLAQVDAYAEGETWEKPWRLTEAGQAALAEN